MSQGVSAAGQDGLFGRAWFAVHEARGGMAVAKADGLEQQGGEVDPQRLQRQERHAAGDVEDARAEEGTMNPNRQPIWNRMYLTRLSYSPRPSSTAFTIVAKLSSVRIMAAASLVTSVPVIPIAIPMSAFFSAGASFTPSPVMATMWPRRLMYQADLLLGCGPGSPNPVDRAQRLLVRHRPELRPGDHLAVDPSWSAMAAAVTAWSPVMMRTLIPAALAVAMDALAVGRGR